MKKKNLIWFALTVCLVGCGKGKEETSSLVPASSPSTSVEKDSSLGSSISSSSSSSLPDEPEKDPSFDIQEKEDDGFVYPQANDYEYPTDLTPTTNIKFTLSEDGSHYIVSDKDHTLDNPTLVIPSTHEGLPVTEIDSEGFVEKTWLKTVYLPSSITKINSGAFSGSAIENLYYDCENLEDLRARNWAFYPAVANQGMKVHFGPHVKRIPSRLFYPLATDPDKRTRIVSVDFDKNCALTSIGDYAFYKAEDYSNIHLPNTVEEIGDYAFYDNGITSLSLSSSLKSIGKYSFAFSKNMTHVQFPTSLSSLGEGAFAYSGLEQIDLSSTSLKEIPDLAFKENVALNRIVLPSAIEKIQEEAFEGDDALEGLKLPDSLISIGKRAFKDCSSLKGLSLNKALTTLEDECFSDLTSLNTLVVSSEHLADLKSGNQVFHSLGKEAKELNVLFTKDVRIIPSRLFYPSANVSSLPKINGVYFEGKIGKVHSFAFYGSSAKVHHPEFLKDTEIQEGNDILEEK